MKSVWLGIFSCALVIYFGIVHSMGNPMLLLNPHAVILVVGGTAAIALLTYPFTRLAQVGDYLMFGFLFRLKKTEQEFVQDLINHIDLHFHQTPRYKTKKVAHPFIGEAFQYLVDHKKDEERIHEKLTDRRNDIKRRYLEDAKILNNIAKYPPHLGLLGAASGMIEMMSGLGTSGVDMIGQAMAIALSATLWGVGLNNFVFLPLADHSMKAAEDDLYLRDIVIDTCLRIKQGDKHALVVSACMDKLSFNIRSTLRDADRSQLEKTKLHNAG